MTLGDGHQSLCKDFADVPQVTVSMEAAALNGAPLSWWVGGPGAGQRQTYWGGALPGSQQCACSLQENCVDHKHHCNCDADHTAWASDSGLLTHKESLPVRSLVLGDVQKPGSESSYMVGPLRCYGDTSTEVLFSFDVGNGPLEVRVKAGVPLNDNRWHRIQAERNVREASLRLDELPAATMESPADGHIHLQLNSQLFVGL
ncbi:hypothetical protein GOODEAATRI_009073 [Goodea atripinnis]|uniref:Laminin G domain-containing protein n=1 Tax=Goodea atripinnis TaxID=208336 RepID=A0ABV0PCP1_9TELE